MQFTFNPTISVSITGEGNGNLSIDELTPGSYSDSNIITVSVASNAVSGYSLGSTVGSSTNASNELRKDGTDTTNKFSSISTNKASLSAFDNNSSTWGYSYSTDDGTTWISGDIVGTTSTGYNGLPVYTTESPIKLINSTTSGSSSIQFKIGARATNIQVSGEYSNIINFIGLANPNPEPIYMQNATLADCGQDMVDIRDYNVYSTASITNLCWMTKNLDLPGNMALTPATTNIDNDYILPASSLDGFNDDSIDYIYNSGSTICNDGPCYSYYSYVAATAKTNPSSGDAIYDICPYGWRLPNQTELAKLITIYTTGDTLTNEPFLAVYAGQIHLTSEFGDTGRYWSSSAYDEKTARRLYFDSNIAEVSYNSKSRGLSIRCVMKTPN